MFETCGGMSLLLWQTFRKSINSLLRLNKDLISGIFKKQNIISKQDYMIFLTKYLFIIIGE